MRAGASFICPSGKPQVLRGHTALVIEGRAALLERLASVAKKLEGTAFAFAEHNDYVEAICPWGNRAALLRAGRRTVSGASRSAFPMSSSTCRSEPRRRSAPSIPRSWACRPNCTTATAPRAVVNTGHGQQLRFRETDRPQGEYDGHHVQIYVTNFSGPHRRLAERNLIYSEDNPYQYRFRDIVDLASGKHLFTVEHEVRSATHPMFMRPMVNRNPAQTNRNYAHGHDQWLWAMGPDQYDLR